MIAIMMAMLMVCAPINAQSRKDKKAAQKAQWELQQQQQKEEAELRHKIKMDSLRNAQKAKEDAAKQAELEAKQAKEKAEADARRAEQEAKRQHQAVDMPCMGAEYKSNETYLRGFADGEDMDTNGAQQSAYISARNNLSGDIEAAIQSLTDNYLKSKSKNKTKEQERELQQLIRQKIDRILSMAPVVCEKYERFYDKDDVEVYKCYVVREVSIESILKPVYTGIQEDESLKIDYDYQKFKEEFKGEFSKASEEQLN